MSLVLMLPILASGCSSTGNVVGKPDGALTLPMDTFRRTPEDTPRTCLIKLYQCNNQIEDGNLRFQLIRN